ncbi:UPF0175 family protein [Halorubrum ruber]|uniref:UPF0175 family protein n=2 Tax=Haloferacaceae TaxID=1644056 RepID=A0A8T8LPF3_9EURY|nr:UPF0175 family protein [Halorubrum ruber]
MAEGDSDLALAVGLYVLGEMTLGEAAEFAEISRQRFRDVLSESAVNCRLGPSNLEDAEYEVQTALDI